MSRKILQVAISLLATCLLCMEVYAGEELPAQIQTGEHRLGLNGSGARTKTFLELYVAGLYLTKPNSNSTNIIAADEPMAIRIKITSGFVSQSSLVDSLEDGFKKVSGGDSREIRKEINQFRECFKDEIKKGDVFEMLYLPNQGVSVSKNGKLMGTVVGAKFKQALFGIWLSDKPADADLKQALLTPTKRR